MVLHALLLLALAVSAAHADIDEMEWGGAPPDETVPSNMAVGRSTVHFESDGRKLEGALYRPKGPGPFPAIVWLHSGERNPGPAAHVGRFAMSHGFVLLAAFRRGHGHSQGTFMGDDLKGFNGEAKKRRMVELQEAEGVDVDEAIGYARSLKFVDKRNIFVAGCSMGGSMAILAADHSRQIRGAIAFAPGASAWDESSYLRERLKAAVRAKHVPLLILQAENDFSLGPARALGPLNEVTGMPSHAKIFGPFGNSPKQADNGFCLNGEQTWSSEVLEFIRAARAK